MAYFYVFKVKDQEVKTALNISSIVAIEELGMGETLITTTKATYVLTTPFNQVMDEIDDIQSD